MSANNPKTEIINAEKADDGQRTIGTTADNQHGTVADNQQTIESGRKTESEGATENNSAREGKPEREGEKAEKATLWQWLKRPKGGWLALVYLLTALSCGGAIALAIVGSENSLLAAAGYAAYAVAAISLAYTVYTIVLYAPTLKKSVMGAIRSNKFAANVVENYGFGTVFWSAISLATTVAFAVMNLVSAINYRLSWYACIAAYYFALILFRAVVLTSAAKCRKKYADNPAKLEKNYDAVYLSGGIFLLILAAATCVAVTKMTIDGMPVKKGQIMAIANAAHAFYKMTMAIINLRKAKKFANPVIQALRNVNFADACMSIASLTTVLLVTFGGESDMLPLKASAGFAACACTIAIAILTIVNACKKMRNQQGEC